jgi:hypothetical protein
MSTEEPHLANEFQKAFREMLKVRQEFIEYQNNGANLTLKPRERGILRILHRRELDGLIGIPVTRLAAEYNMTAFDKDRASESTICAEIAVMEGRNLVKRVPRGKSQLIELDDGGRKFMEAESQLMDERLGIYLKVCPTLEQQRMVIDFCNQVVTEFKSRMV